MILLSAPLVLLLSIGSLPWQEERLGVLTQAALVAEKSGQTERAVWLWRRAESEAGLAKDKVARAEIRARIEKYSPKEAKQRKLMTGAARSLRKAGLGYLRKKQWADAFELLSLAESVEPSVEGDRGIVRCLFDAKKARSTFPSEAIFKYVVAHDPFDRKGEYAYRMQGPLLISPNPQQQLPAALPFETNLASMPGLSIDVDLRMPGSETQAGIYLGEGDGKQRYCLVELHKEPDLKPIGMSAYVFLPRPRSSYSFQGGSFEKVDLDDWIPLHLEVRSGEISVSVGDNPLRVIPVPSATLDGLLGLRHEALLRGQAPNSYRNLRVRPLLDMKRALLVRPEKLQGHELDRLFAEVQAAIQFKIPWLAQAYLERIGALAGMSSSEEAVRKSQIQQLKKVDRLRGGTLSARKSASKRLATLARAEEKAGRKSLAHWYLKLSRRANSTGSAADHEAGPGEDEAQVADLFPSLDDLFARAKSLGQTGSWKLTKDDLESPRPRTDASSLLLFPTLPGTDRRLEFSLDPACPQVDVVLCHRSKQDALFLRLTCKKGRIETQLFQATKAKPTSLCQMTAYSPKGSKEARIRVRLELHEHHIILDLEGFAPRVLPLERRRLEGPMGFHLPAQSARRAVVLRHVVLR